MPSRTGPVDIYIAGTVDGPDGRVAAYWKNGSRVDLSPAGSGYGETTFVGMVVCGGETIALGNTEVLGDTPPRSQGVIWRGGEAEPLDEPAWNLTTDVAVTRDDVHVVGGDILANDYSSGTWTIATVHWTNGDVVELAPPDPPAAAWAIAIEGDDVYVGGGRFGGDGDAEGLVWKNDALLFTVPDALHQQIAVSEGVVHSIMTEEQFPRYFVGEQLQELAAAYQLRALEIIDGDVYIAGESLSQETGKRVASYWKNGERVDLTDGSFASFARSIDVWDGEVYVLGEEGVDEDVTDEGVDTTTEPRLWRDGSPASYPADETLWMTADSLVLASP